MPTYTVLDRTQSTSWNVTGSIPSPGQPPRAVLPPQLGWAEVTSGVTFNFPMDEVEGIDGFRAPAINGSVFCVLWRPGPSGGFRQGAMAHMPGLPDPNAVNWGSLLTDMPYSGTFYSILVNPWTNGQTQPFLDEVERRTPIGTQNMWVYNAESALDGFCFDRHGNAGEF